VIVEACLLACSLYYSALKVLDTDDGHAQQKVKGGSPVKRRKAPNPPADSPDKNQEQSRYLPAVNEKKPNNVQVNKYLAVTSISLFLTSIGTLFYPPLIVFGVAGLVYPLAGIVKRAYKGLVYEKKVKMEVMGSILFPGMVLSGFYFTSCFAFWMYYLSAKLLIKIEDDTRQNLIGIFGDQPRFVWIVKGDTEVEMPFDALRIGDIVAVRSGETIPVDGIITEGSASIDQHVLTGESQPLEKEIGGPVFALTTVLAGSIRIRVEKSGKDTVVSNIVDMLNKTVDFKSTMQSAGEMISDFAVIPTLALSAAAYTISGVDGSFAALNSYVGGDVRLFVPLSTLNFLRLASRNGILIKDGRALEMLTRADTVVFDKTGTLTLDQPYVSNIYPCNGFNEMDVLYYAASAENRQTHPIAKAVIEKAREHGLSLSKDMDDTSYEMGRGIRVTLSGNLIRVGSQRFMEIEGIEIPDAMKEIIYDSQNSGHSLVLASKDDRILGTIELQATIRPEIKDIIKQLRNRGKAMYIITGDHEKPARMLADELGIENVFAEVFPEQKAMIVERLQDEGRTVCYIGDGINDSIAMKKAHASISLRGASSVATDTANIIFMNGTLDNLDKLFELATEFKINTTNALMLAILPGIINMASVFLLHTGIYFALGLYYINLPLGVANSFLPLLEDYKRKGKSKQTSAEEKPSGRPFRHAVRRQNPPPDLSKPRTDGSICPTVIDFAARKESLSSAQ
jgi:heavy metal translocating P-type ATPase